MTIKHSQGLTLVEIMVAMLISLILMAGVLSIMSSSKKTYALQSELGVLQDNARFVMNELVENLRMAGFGGCSVINSPFLDDGSVNDQTIKEQNGNNISLAVPQSDRIIIQASELLEYVSTQTFTATTNVIALDVDNDFLPAVNDVVRVVDCGQFDDRTVTSFDNTTDTTEHRMTLDSALSASYEVPLDVLFQYSVQYEVCQTDEIEFGLFKGTDGITGSVDGTICDEDDTGNAMTGKELVVEGVENMQIRYGVDTDGDNIPNRYNTTPGGVDTISVRVTLLMRTLKKRLELVDATDKDFDLDPDLSYNPNQDAQAIESGYRHRLFTTTIFIRNSSSVLMN
ncbi:MAG: PilW family protein [Thiomargarita sp.]|nr:PilW family protein [Thiomargarita sp.]